MGHALLTDRVGLCAILLRFYCCMYLCGMDRFLWQDERENWHLIMHNMGEKGVVAQHAFSRDGAGGGKPTAFVCSLPPPPPPSSYALPLAFRH